MGITKKFRRAIALVACVAVMVMNSVLPVYPIIYAIDDTVHDAVYYEDGEPEDGDTEGGEPEDGEPEDGDTEGGETEDGETEDGDTEGGDTEGGDTENGETEDGETENGETEDGETEDGETEDGETEDGETEDGETEDGETEDGETEDGETEDGEIEDGETEDGEIEDGEVEEEMETEEALLTLYDGAEVDTVWYDVYGEGQQTYSIRTEAGLRGLAYLVNEKNVLFAGKTIELANDISLNGEWVPIGADASNSFMGTFNGNTKTISGLSITTGAAYRGLFGHVKSAVIEDVTVTGVIALQGASVQYVGGIIGRSEGTGSRISGCVSNVAIDITIASSSPSSTSIGGIAGEVPNPTRIISCENHGDINLEVQGTIPAYFSYVGGLVGYINGNSSVSPVMEKCVNTGNITGAGSYAGGLVGRAYQLLTINKSSNTGSVTGVSDYIGGFVGNVDYGALEITDSRSEGAVTGGGSYIGGLAGCTGSGMTIMGSHNEGAVTGGGSYTGGLAGCTGTAPAIMDSYNSGDVTGGTTYTGGVAGQLSTSGASIIRLEGVRNEGDVTGGTGDYTGGVAGYVGAATANSADVRVTGCSNTGAVTGANYTGGVFGQIGANFKEKITFCYNEGDIQSSGAITGGVAADAGNSTWFTACYNAGDIVSSADSVTALGGVTGRNGTGSYVVSCFNAGGITKTAVDGTTGGVTGVNYADNKKSYYNSDKISFTATDSGAGLSGGDFASGKAAYLMDDGADGGIRTSYWSQGEHYPVLAGIGAPPVYKVELDEFTGGNVSLAGGEYVMRGEVVDLGITAEAGKILSLLTVKGRFGGNPRVTIAGNSETASFDMPGEDVLVTAAFIEDPGEGNVTVTFDANGGVLTTDETVSVAAGGRVEKPETDPTWDGFDFDYWSKTQNDPAEYDFNTAVTGAFTLYAIWREEGKVRVTFSMSGVDVETPLPPLFVDPGSLVAKPETPRAVSAGGDMYMFEGWYADRGGVRERWDFDNDRVSEDITLYAKWIKGDNKFETTTKESPLIIETAAVLKELADYVNAGHSLWGGYYKLGADIDLNDEEWIPIGSSNTLMFEGNFDGGGFTVQNIKITGTTNYRGLFGYVNGGTDGITIKNVTVTGSISGGQNIGGVVGYANGKVEFTGCVNNAVIAGTNYVGGVAGRAAGTAIFVNCKNGSNGKVSGSTSAYVGGIASYAAYADFTDCSNVGTVASGGRIGGIVGFITRGNFVNCENKGPVQGSSTVGGIAGNVGSNSTFVGCVNESQISGQGDIAGIAASISAGGVLTDCENKGDIESAQGSGSSNNAGGIIGNASGMPLTLTRVSNSGDVKGVLNAGGLVASVGDTATSSSAATVEYCYNTGDVTVENGGGGLYVGGIFGKLSSYGSIRYCYNTGDITVTALSYVGGVGGIVGINNDVSTSKIGNCFSSGSTSVKANSGGTPIWNNVGGIAGTNASGIKNCYFKASSSNLFADRNYGVVLSEEAFTTGEAAWRLDKGGTTARTQLWGHDDINGHPVFTSGAYPPVYRLSVEQADNGEVAPGIEYAPKGGQATLTVTPDSGYKLFSFSLTNASGAEHPFTLGEASQITVSFSMPAFDLAARPEFILASSIGGGPYTVTFDTNGAGTEAPPPLSVQAGERATKPDDPAKDGFIFMGWYNKKDFDASDSTYANFLGKTPFHFTTLIVEETNLVACWRPDNSVLVIFDLNRAADATGNPSSIDPQVVKEGGTIGSPESVPTWEIQSKVTMMKFTGWWTEADGGEMWTFSEPLKDISINYPNGTLILYAHWEEAPIDGELITIEDIDDLVQLANRLNQAGIDYDGVTITLGDDIELPETWDGIGKMYAMFQGTFEGDGHTITLHPSQSNPLFNYVGENGSVQDLKIEGVLSTDKTRNNFGGVAGYNYGTIADCKVNLSSGSFDSSGDPIAVFGTQCGGVAGNNGRDDDKDAEDRAIIENCQVSMKAKSDSTHFGGIVGLSSSGRITDCELLENSIVIGGEGSGGIVGIARATDISGCGNNGAKITAIGQGSGGGIAGLFAGGDKAGGASITGCTNNADVTAAMTAAGGIVGKTGTNTGNNNINGGSTPIMIEDCHNTGAITGNYANGGIIGRAIGEPAKTIRNCSNSGEVRAGGNEGAGGIIGFAEVRGSIAIEGGENTGPITGLRSAGGILGFTQLSATVIIENCVNNAAVTLLPSTGAYNVGGLVGVSNNNFTMTNCVSSGKTSGTTASNIGGLIGSAAGATAATAATNITNCTWSGTLSVNSGATSTAQVGGAIGSFLSLAGDVVLDAENLKLGDNFAGRVTVESTVESPVTGSIGYFGVVIGGVSSTGGKLTVEGFNYTSDMPAAAMAAGGVIGRVNGYSGELTVNNCNWEGNLAGGGALAALGGIIGAVDSLNATASATPVMGKVMVENSSWKGAFTGTLQTAGGVIGNVGTLNSAVNANGKAAAELVVENVGAEGSLDVAATTVGGVIGNVGTVSGVSNANGDAAAKLTVKDVGLKGDMTSDVTTAGGLIGSVGTVGVGAEVEVENAGWEGSFTATAQTAGGVIGVIGAAAANAVQGNVSVRHVSHVGDIGASAAAGGLIGRVQNVGATGNVQVADVYSVGDFSGDTDGGTGGIIGNITSLADGASVALENAYWYGAGIHPDNDKAGGIIGNIDENSGSLTVGNTYYGFSDGTEPAEESEGDALDDGITITFKSKADFERGEVSYLLMEGAVTDEGNMAAIASDGVTWEQDWENKYPVFGEHRTHRITSALLRQDSEGQLTPEPDASLVIAAKSPGSPSETAYDDFGGSVEVSVVDIPEGYTVESISIAGGSPESIGNNGTFTLDGDAQVTAIIGEVPPEPPPPDEDEEEDPGTGNGGNGGRGKKGRGSGTGDGTGGDGDGLTPGGDPGLSGDTGALYPLPDGDTPTGSDETEGAEKASSPAKDETLPESFVAAQQPESAETSSSFSAAPPVEEQEPDETTESNVEGGADDEFAQGGPADESKNEPKAESDATGALKVIEDVVKSNLPLIIAVAIAVAVITAVSGFLRYRKKRNSDDNIGM